MKARKIIRETALAKIDEILRHPTANGVRALQGFSKQNADPEVSLRATLATLELAWGEREPGKPMKFYEDITRDCS